MDGDGHDAVECGGDDCDDGDIAISPSSVEVCDAEGAPIPGAGVAVAERLLRVGVLALPAGDSGAVIELSPPAVLTEGQVQFAVAAVVDAVRTEAT